MLKVLIVENEALERVHLKNLIDWEALGYQVVGEAENGGDGLVLIGALQPDIVITDIRMPVVNGLELMAATIGPHRPEFLIMSGYDDYDLVRRGLTLGAYDYLRKLDVSQSSLLQALGGIRDRINSRAQGSAESHPTPPPSDSAALRILLLGPVLKGLPYDETELARTLGQSGIILNPEDVYCAVIRIDSEALEADFHESTPVGRSVLGITDEILRAAFHSLCFQGKPGQFIAFASPRTPDADPDNLFERTIARLVEMLAIYLNVEAKGGLGSSQAEPKGLQLAYQRASTALENRFFFEGRKTIPWKEIPVAIRQKGGPTPLTQKEDLRLALDDHRKDHLVAFFDRFQEEVGHLEWSVSSVKEGLIELNYLVREYFESNQLDPAQVLRRSRMTYADIGAMQDVGEARRWVLALAVDLVDFLNGEAKVEYSRVILNTKRYVAEHYGEDLTLATVAVQACLSPNYFSSLFKKHSGMSFSEHLNDVRISAAKHFLAETDLLIYEVAEKCGYHDSYYFNRVFKKMTGTSPGAYRKASETG